jgi:hypothetical protein
MADVQAPPRYSLVTGDPAEHKQDWLALADRNLPFAIQGREARYSKYYEEAPLGPAKFVLARDSHSGDAFVGMAAIFPTQLRIFGELVPAAIAGDFAVDDGHRGLGPAIPLQRAAVANLGEHGLACAYGYPNVHSEPITRRVGYKDLGALTRYVKVLRSRIVVDQYVKSRPLARVASGASRVLVDPFLSLVSRERVKRLPRGYRVERPAAFDERFDGLWQSLFAQGTITSERNAELLNWRYEMGRPDGIYSVLALIGPDEQVAAYAVHRVRNEIHHIVDIVFQQSQEVLDALLAELIRDARRDRAVAISLIHLGGPGLLTERLPAFEFRHREERSHLHVFVPGDSEREQALTERSNWYFLNADADL